MKKLKVFNPYDNSLIDEISIMSGRQVEAALELAHDYYQDRDAWLKPHQRMVILERFLGLLQENKEKVTREAQKPRSWCQEYTPSTCCHAWSRTHCYFT